MKASRIEADYGEYEQLFKDIKKRIEECEKKTGKEKSKYELEKLKASKMREAATESFVQSKTAFELKNSTYAEEAAAVWC